MQLMRKLALCLCVVLFYSPASFANPYLLISGGGGGAAKAGSVSVEGGGTRAIANSMPLAIELSAAFTDNAPSDLLDYNVPHNDYTDQGTKNKGAEYGFLIKSGYTFDNLSILIGAGASFQEEVNVAQSNATGWYYTQSKETKANFQGYGGLLYKAGNLAISAGYDNRRGVVGGIGYIF